MANNRKKIRKRNDQKKVQRRIKRDPDFIDRVLHGIYGPDVYRTVNLYNELSDLRREEPFLDLALARYLIGNGLLKPKQTPAHLLRKPGFDFQRQYYQLTKKGSQRVTSWQVSPND